MLCFVFLLTIYSVLAWRRIQSISEQLREIKIERFIYSTGNHSYISYADINTYPSLLSFFPDGVVEDKYIVAFPKSVCMSCVYSLLSEIKDSDRVSFFKFVLTAEQSYLKREIAAFGENDFLEIETPLSDEDGILIMKFQRGVDKLLYIYYSETDQDKFNSLLYSK